MAASASDRNLLFGILALQMDFISRDALIGGMHAWVLNKTTALGDILLQQGALGSDRRALLDALVNEHLKQHGNDPEQSLAAVSSINSVREDLARIADADLHASLAHVSRPGATPDGGHDPFATVSVGTSTSSGSRFRILRPHAKGGMGEVFLAHDEELHRQVALKQMQDRHADDPDIRSRFLVEAEITGGLEHPGIVPVYGLGNYADGRPFYAMRFIKGQSLGEAIKTFFAARRPEADGTGSPYTGVEFRNLLGRFLDVCHAIQYAHDRGVLHRDLKPGNIMLGPYGETLVVDWGLAKAVGEPGASATGVGSGEPPLRPASGSGVAETVAGQAIGTPQYMSPEQAACRPDLLGPASDVYCLGATLYSLLSGKAPFDRADLALLLGQVERGEFPPPRQVKPAVPRALEAVCLKAMATRPQDRYATPQQLAGDVERWLADEPVSAWPEPVLRKAGRWVRRHKPLVSGAVAALLVGLVGLSAGAIWFEQEQARQAQEQLVRENEAERQRLLTEQGIDQALKQGSKARGDLQVELRKPGGVQALLNQQARWQALLKGVQVELTLARSLAKRAGDDLDAAWTTRIQQLAKELLRDEADHSLAVRLEKIRLDKATFADGEDNFAKAEREYSKTFHDEGIATAPGSQKEVVALIQQSAIKEQLLAALDDWAGVAYRSNPDLTIRLFAVARLADPDSWRDQFRSLTLWKDDAAIVKLAEQTQADEQQMAEKSPQMLIMLSSRLPQEKKEKWLRQAQAIYPADFWINFELAGVLNREKSTLDSVESAGFNRVALALRPDNTAAYNNLGTALASQKNLSAAVAAYEKALKIAPRNAKAWYNLGNALQDQGKLREAINAYNEAVSIEPKYAFAWYNLGNVRRAQKNLPAAVIAFTKAVKSEPTYAKAWYNLGNTLRDQEKLPAAIDAYKKAVESDSKHAHAWNMLGLSLLSLGDQNELPAAINACRKALEIKPNLAEAWMNLTGALRAQRDAPAIVNVFKKAVEISLQDAKAWYNLGLALSDVQEMPAAIDAFKSAIRINPSFGEAHFAAGMALRDQGDFADGPASAQRALQWFPKGHAQRPFGEQLLKECQQLLALEERLPNALKGQKLSSGEPLALAYLCQRYKKRYYDAVELWVKAFAEDPKAEDPGKYLRYKAACAAALAAAGKGVGADNLPDKEKSRLRQQAFEWLKADLAARGKLLQQNRLAAVQLEQDFQHWQKDADLAGVRDAKELARLPAAEQDAWRQLWADVEALRKQARSSYTETLHKGTLTRNQREQTHSVEMSAGKTYVIDLESPQFDTYLRLENSQGNVLKENDDVSPDNQNSRIVFTPKDDGTYRVIATSFEQRGSGAYTLTTRAFAARDK